MRDAPEKQMEKLMAQVTALTKASATGVFLIHLNRQDQLIDLDHPDNWVAADPKLVGLPEGSGPTIAQIFYLFDPEQKNIVPEINNSIAAKNPKFVRTTPITRSNGETGWLELKIHYDKDNDGNVRRLKGTITDKTREYSIHSGLRDLGEFLNNILLEVPVAIFRLDIKAENSGIADFASITGNWMINASTLYGQPKDTVKSPLDTLNYIHPDDREAVAGKFNEANEKGYSRYEVEYRTIWPDGSLHWLASKTFREVDKQGNLVAINGIQYDITERKLQQQRIEFMAGHDALTDLPNRALCMETLERAVAAGRRYNRKFAVIYVDLDNFKIINDTLGHDAGDKLLVDISERFRNALRAGEFIARIGGDEFVVIADEVSTQEQVAVIASRIIEATGTPVELQGKSCQVTASLGISIFPADSTEGDSLLKSADIALYIAKEKGRNNYQFYDAELAKKSRDQRRNADRIILGKTFQ